MTFARRLALVLLVALGSIATRSPIAQADDPEPEVSSQPARSIWDRVLAVELVGGVDTPWGVLGSAVVVAPIQNLQLDLGGGVSRDGGRVTGGVRLVLPHANGAFGVRIGLAGGPLVWDVRSPDPASPGAGSEQFVTQRRVWDFVGFLDLSVSLEIRLDEGVYGRLMLGAEHALAAADRCTETHADGTTSACGSGEGPSWTNVPVSTPIRSYLGLSIGYAFDL